MDENKILKRACRLLHDDLSYSLNAEEVMGSLFADGVISELDMEDLDGLARNKQCTKFLLLLHRSSNKHAFICLRKALKNKLIYTDLVKQIDEKCNQLKKIKGGVCGSFKGLRISSELTPLPGYIELSTEPCCLSLDDYPGIQRPKMSCGCVFDVLEMKRICQSMLNEGKFEFVCPMCDNTWEYFVVRHVLKTVMTKKELIGMCTKVSKNSLKSQHTQTCCSCKSVFSRDFTKKWYSDKTRVRCTVCTKMNGYVTDICWRCGNSWKLNELGGCGNAGCAEEIRSAIERLAVCESKQIGQVTLCPNTRACPRCGQLIEHTEGDKQTECTECYCEFCFVCLQMKTNDTWQCGTSDSVCPVAARQTSIPDDC